MAKDDRDLLDLLRFELKFLEDGGYGRSPHTPWRRPLVFEDSLSCLNFGDPAHTHPCSECLLMEFVPAELRDEVSPCRLIPLTPKGETVDYFFRCGTQLELEEALAGWLRDQISQIEEKREQASRRSQQPPPAQTGWMNSNGNSGWPLRTICTRWLTTTAPTMTTWWRMASITAHSRRHRKSPARRAAYLWHRYSPIRKPYLRFCVRRKTGQRRVGLKTSRWLAGSHSARPPADCR